MPLTKVTNKHLLPVFDQPMIYYPIETLKKLGVQDVLIISGGNHIGSIAELLSDGGDWGMNFTYKIQRNPDGIAGALLLAEDFIQDKPFYTILGDNIFLSDILGPSMDDTAVIYVQEVPDAYRFGTYVPEKKTIIEKPAGIKKGLCVTGLYRFLPDVFEYIKTLSPSARGELEITDVNNWYLSRDKMEIIDTRNWYDAGTFLSLLEASIAVNNRPGE